MADGSARLRSVRVAPATFRDASYVAANMRDQDLREFEALIDMDQPGLVACDLVHRSEGLAFCAFIKDQPVACYGVTPLFSHLWSAWAFGTSKLRRAIPEITRHALEVTKPALIERGVTRLQVHTLADHDLSHSWLASMGARYEAPAFGYGRHGEDFKVYAWVRKS